MECSQRNGEIDGYRLIYNPTMNSDDNENILIDGSNTNTYTVVGLQPQVDYTLVLGAVGGNYMAQRIAEWYKLQCLQV